MNARRDLNRLKRSLQLLTSQNCKVARLYWCRKVDVRDAIYVGLLYFNTNELIYTCVPHSCTLHYFLLFGKLNQPLCRTFSCISAT